MKLFYFGLIWYSFRYLIWTIRDLDFWNEPKYSTYNTQTPNEEKQKEVQSLQKLEQKTKINNGILNSSQKTTNLPSNA